MAHQTISAQDLRGASFPTAKSGYDSAKVDAVLELCAGTIEELENQVGELQRSVALARAESSPIELNNIADDEDVIAQWLTTLDPLDIDREVQKTIAEAIVESTMAASHIRSEARERIKALIDAVAHEVQKLLVIVKDSQKSVAAANQLPTALIEWEGEFSGRIGTLLQQLQLPWTVQVSQLAKVLSHMAENPGIPMEDTKKIHSSQTKAGKDDKSERSPSIKRKQTTSDASDKSATTKGQWD